MTKQSELETSDKLLPGEPQDVQETWSYKVHPDCVIIFYDGEEMARSLSVNSAALICARGNATEAPQDVREPVAWRIRVREGSKTYHAYTERLPFEPDVDSGIVVLGDPKPVYAAPSDLKITQAEMMAIGDTVTTLRKMEEAPTIPETCYDCGVREPCDDDCPNHVDAPLTHLSEATTDAIRAKGWSVAVHNDYRLNGEFHTFWLFTKDGRAIKGEGKSDTDALAQIAQAIGGLGAARPFYGAECSSYPNCNGGCGLGCTKEMDGAGAGVGKPNPCDDLISQIEARFPNWKSYRDLVDCIDCTLHQLRAAQT